MPFHGSHEFVNNPVVIAKNPQLTSINSAIQIDLTGQVCADSMGHKIYSGVGGQVDFVLGASFSEHGKSIIAHPEFREELSREVRDNLGMSIYSGQKFHS